MDNAIIEVTPEAINSTAISVMPRGAETPHQAVTRQMATYKAINTLIDNTFVDGVDYDYMPGTKKEDIEAGNAKKNLLLPGMEKARTLLGLREEYRDIYVVRDFETPFFYFEVECILYSIATGVEVGRGQGVCHTREKSFMRSNIRVCPTCGKSAIKKSGYAPRGSAPGTKPGWYCDNKKADGCGANFSAEDTSITSQETGSAVDTQLVMDGLNRCRKIANKRAFAEPIKKIAMMSGRFTVDMEDFDTYTVTDDAPPSKIITMTPPAPKPAVVETETTPEPPAPWHNPEALFELAERSHTAGMIGHSGEEGVRDMEALIQPKVWSSFSDRKEAALFVKAKFDALKAMSITVDDTKNLLKTETGSSTRPTVTSNGGTPVNGATVVSPFGSDTIGDAISAEQLAQIDASIDDIPTTVTNPNYKKRPNGAANTMLMDMPIGGD